MEEAINHINKIHTYIHTYIHTLHTYITYIQCGPKVLGPFKKKKRHVRRTYFFSKISSNGT